MGIEATAKSLNSVLNQRKIRSGIDNPPKTRSATPMVVRGPRIDIEED